MAETTARDAKLVQYLQEAHGKEKELETSLQAHIAMTTRRPYKKRLQQHLRETKDHARQVERRVKKLGGASLLQTATARGTEVVSRGTALAKGPLHAVRGTGEEEIQLKNAITEHSEEGEEIARYTAIEALPRPSATRTPPGWHAASVARRSAWPPSSPGRSRS